MSSCDLRPQVDIIKVVKPWPTKETQYKAAEENKDQGQKHNHNKKHRATDFQEVNSRAIKQLWQGYLLSSPIHDLGMCFGVCEFPESHASVNKQEATQTEQGTQREQNQTTHCTKLAAANLNPKWPKRQNWHQNDTSNIILSQYVYYGSYSSRL